MKITLKELEETRETFVLPAMQDRGSKGFLPDKHREPLNVRVCEYPCASMNGYSWDTCDLCTCDHISGEVDAQHCLGSLEKPHTAAQEGWAHFYAADLFNNPNSYDPPPYFGYYKKVVWPGPGGTVVEADPPVGVAVFNPAYPSWGWRWYHWACECNNHDGGVEMDWMAFFYALNNWQPGRFNYYDIADLFIEACGGSRCAPPPHEDFESLYSAGLDLDFPEEYTDHLWDAAVASGVRSWPNGCISDCL